MSESSKIPLPNTKMLQLPVKTIPFLPLTHYKTIQTNWEKNKTYWNNIAYQFLQQKHNIDTSYLLGTVQLEDKSLQSWLENTQSIETPCDELGNANLLE